MRAEKKKAVMGDLGKFQLWGKWFSTAVRNDY